MPDRTINDHVLNALLLDQYDSKLLLFEESSFYFEDLYTTGCRSTELLMPELWEKTNDGYKLTTLKTGTARIIPEQDLSANFKLSLADGERPYGSLTYDQLTAEFRRSVQLHPIYAGNRIADTYLYRYNRTRLEFKLRPDLKTLMAYMGWTNPATASKYLTTPLIYEPCDLARL